MSSRIHNSKIVSLSASPSLVYSSSQDGTRLSDVISSITNFTLKRIVAYLGHVHPLNSLGIRGLPTSSSTISGISLGIRDLSTSSSTISGRNSISVKPGELEDIVPLLPQHLESPSQARDLIQRGYTNFYERKCKLMISPGGSELRLGNVDAVYQEWYHDVSALGFLSFRYASTSKLNIEDGDDSLQEDKKLILCQFKAEFRAKKLQEGDFSSQEEKEMTTLHGTGKNSFPDALKLSALIGLHNPSEAHAVEVHSSLTGNQYRYLVNATNRGLCVNIVSSESNQTINDITQVRLLLENIPFGMVGHESSNLEKTSSFHRKIMNEFLILRTTPSEDPSEPRNIARGSPSMHVLLLDKSQSGFVYINGRFVTKWSSEIGVIASHYPALFGFDLLGIPLIEDKDGKLTISDYQKLKYAYSQLMQEVLIDASQQNKNFAGKLLSRLVKGYDEDDQPDESQLESINQTLKFTCLEAEIMSNPKYDPVGICAKALATHFAKRYGADAFPCLAYEVDDVKNRIGPHREPVAVPQRVIDVLRRGGYFDLSFTEKDLWFTDIGHHLHFNDLKASSKAIVQSAVKAVQQAERRIVNSLAEKSAIGEENIVFVSSEHLGGGKSLTNFSDKFMCRYNKKDRKFYVNDAVLFLQLAPFLNHAENNDFRRRAFMLGLFLSKEHENPNFFLSYIMNNSS